MRGWVNDALRFLLGMGIVALGIWLDVVQRFRIRTYDLAQARLRIRYRIGPTTPVLSYGPELEHNIAARVEVLDERTNFAFTSGSTGAPKRLLYPAERVRRSRWAFIDAFARSFVHMPFKRHSFYVFSSLHQDGSLSSLMLAEHTRPSYLACLQAPDRLQADPALRGLAERYGDAALRLWVLCLSNPGVLYSTNPSTLSAFLDSLVNDWLDVSALVRDFVERPGDFSPAVHALAKRLECRGARARLRRVAGRASANELSDIAPAVHAYVCWTGGYVQPFLERLAARLPAPRYRLLPMYSMSTETPETTPCYRGDEVAFLPLAPGVLYEFLAEGSADEGGLLVPARAVKPGGTYTMVVSDAYGLRRYQTDDLFACTGVVNGLPDLRFLRRRSLSYSFTGEKLTGEQARLALDRLRTEFEALGAGAYLTLVPSGDGVLPHYWLLRVDSKAADAAPMEVVALRCDALLSELNSEYRAKRASGRLGPMLGASLDRDEFLHQMGGSQASGSWEAQFKFLPLYTRRWVSGS